MQIKDIAKMAGVAPSTVSRVINHSGYVSAPVREQVEKIIRETGYVPNSVAKSLKMKRTDTIGVIIPQIASESMAKTLDGVSEICAQHGCHLLLANAGLDMRNELELLKSLPLRQIDGLLFMAAQVTQAHHEAISALEIPAVVTGQMMQGIPCVVHDDFGAARDITRLLLRRGRQKIAFINVKVPDEAIRHQRYKGFLLAMEEAGLPVCADWIDEGDFSLESGAQAAQRIWSRTREKPDALLAVTDKMAVGAMDFLRASGIPVPDAVAVAGIGNNKLSRYISPALSTVEYFHEQAGRLAAGMLFDEMDSPGSVHGCCIVPYELVQRESTGGQPQGRRES